MNKVFLEYSDITSNVRVRLPPSRIEECKKLNIPVSEIVRHRERYNNLFIPNNWEHCAVRAIEEKKMKMRKQNGGFGWL
jgi:hypothetical protein